MSPLQSVLLDAAGWLPACLTPPASPAHAPGLAGTGWAQGGAVQEGQEEFKTMVSHHAVSTVGTGGGQ